MNTFNPLLFLFERLWSRGGDIPTKALLHTFPVFSLPMSPTTPAFIFFPSFDNRLGGLIAASSGLCFPSPSPFPDLACYWRQSNKVEYKVGICVKLKWLRLLIHAPHGDWGGRDIDMIDKSVSFYEDTLYTVMLLHPHVLFKSVHAYLMLLTVSKFHLFY